VRNITRGGTYFCPSYRLGSGRSFDRAGILRKLQGIHGYIVTDIEAFPTIPYWVVPRGVVEDWWNAGRLGAGTKMSREKALQLIQSLP